jgi:cellulose synthase/poly-beta-1,6-N-acetylglucosamine synthase-like glycosyltransferase
VLDVLHTITLVFLGIPIFVFGFYGIILFYFSRLPKKQSAYKSVDFEPSVSIVIPTHDEELIITKKIDNTLSLEYPQEKVEVIFVDDSSDSTPKIIEEQVKKFPNIHLIRFNERMGYSPSMIAGCKAAKNEIVVFAEAGSFLSKQAIRNLVRHFANPDIGLVTGRSIILNTNEEIGNAEKSYLDIANFLRYAESQMDSTFWVKGEATAVRRELVTDLEECNATFDNTSALFVRQKGYKAIYDPDVTFSEYAPTTYKDWSKQKTIRGANWIKILWRFRKMFFNRKYGLFGCLTLPMQFAMLVIAPLALLMAAVSLVILTFFDPFFSLVIWGIIGFLLALSVLFKRRLVVTAFEFEFSLLRALYQIAFTRTEHDKIDKALSTRTKAVGQSG